MAKGKKKSKGYSIPQGDDEASVAAREGTNQTAEAMIDSPPPPMEVQLHADSVAESQVEPAPVEVIEEEVITEAMAVAEVEEDNAKPNSVVAPKFKDKYLANARAWAISGKAAKRSNWDWLSQWIASQVLNDKHKLMVSEFYALMEANGVDASKWTNRNKGWEGRLRTTGRVALQKKVANANELVLLDGTTTIPPEEWAAKYRDKE